MTSQLCTTETVEKILLIAHVHCTYSKHLQTCMSPKPCWCPIHSFIPVTWLKIISHNITPSHPTGEPYYIPPLMSVLPHYDNSPTDYRFPLISNISHPSPALTFTSSISIASLALRHWLTCPYGVIHSWNICYDHHISKREISIWTIALFVSYLTLISNKLPRMSQIQWKYLIKRIWHAITHALLAFVSLPSYEMRRDKLADTSHRHAKTSTLWQT